MLSLAKRTVTAFRSGSALEPLVDQPHAPTPVILGRQHGEPDGLAQASCICPVAFTNVRLYTQDTKQAAFDEQIKFSASRRRAPRAPTGPADARFRSQRTNSEHWTRTRFHSSTRSRRTTLKRRRRRSRRSKTSSSTSESASPAPRFTCALLIRTPTPPIQSRHLAPVRRAGAPHLALPRTGVRLAVDFDAPESNGGAPTATQEVGRGVQEEGFPEEVPRGRRGQEEACGRGQAGRQADRVGCRGAQGRKGRGAG